MNLSSTHYRYLSNTFFFALLCVSSCVMRLEASSGKPVKPPQYYNVVFADGRQDYYLRSVIATTPSIADTQHFFPNRNKTITLWHLPSITKERVDALFKILRILKGKTPKETYYSTQEHLDALFMADLFFKNPQHLFHSCLQHLLISMSTPGIDQINKPNNDIQQLPPFLPSSLRTITSLNLHHNYIRELPYKVFRWLPHLRKLDLSNNRIAHVCADGLSGPKKLQSLNLESNEIKTILGSPFKGLSHLTYLNLANNNLTGITPKTFEGLAKLNVLVLEGNRFPKLPANVFACLPALTRLKLNSGALSVLDPQAFVGLANLTALDLSGNNIAAIPDRVFESLVRLNNLTIAHNRIQSITAHTCAGLAALTTLTANNNVITQVDTNAFAHTPHLAALSLANNRLTQIDASLFTKLPKIEEVDLNNNRITRTQGAFPKQATISLLNNPVWYAKTYGTSYDYVAHQGGVSYR